MRTDSDGGVRARVMRARITGVAALAITVGLWVYSIVVEPLRWLMVPPLQLVAVALVAVLVLAAAARELPTPRFSAGAVLFFGVIGLLGWAWVFESGPSAVPALVAKWAQYLPPPLIAAAMVLLAVALLSPGKFGRLAILLNLAASAALFLLCLGHLFDVAEFVRPVGVAPAGPAASGLMFLVSLAALGLHADGPLSAYFGTDPGSVARRRLLPAAVLTPVASGGLLVYALESQRLSPTLAVAITVFVNVLVMLLLVNAAGNKVTRVVWDRQRRMEAREARVRKKGLRDALTNLLNRGGWDAEVESAERTCRNSKVNACVLVVDLDGLKLLNDSEGHKEGDLYIRRAAMALRKAARRGEPLARLGGDEFAYLVVDCDETAAAEVVRRFETALKKGRISASVGYAMRNDGTLADAFEAADAEMYRQKRARKRRRA